MKDPDKKTVRKLEYYKNVDDTASLYLKTLANPWQFLLTFFSVFYLTVKN